MKRAFKYDVAITAADFDALAVAELKRRLEQRLSKPVHASTRVQPPAPPTVAAGGALAVAAPVPVSAPASTIASLRKAVEKDARVVVVLFQRLWGSTPAGEAEVAGLKARIGTTKHKDVIVVPLDNARVPAWLKGSVVRPAGDPTSTAVVDAIVAAVTAAGGAPKRQTDAAAAARHAEEDQRARARQSFLTSQRALTLINRELDSLSATVLKLCEAPGTLPAGLAPEVRRTPDRYTVQIGPVGLSFSWIRGRSNAIADGQLLVIEWSGQLGENHGAADVQAAMPAFEHVLQPHATSPDDWQWRRTDLDLCRYTTRDLAGQCVASIVRRLPADSAEAASATA